MTIIEDDRWKERRGTAADLATVNEVPLDGERVLETDTGKEKIGDGSTNYNSLKYSLSGRVDFTGLADGNVLVWDAADGLWKPGSGGGSGSLESVVAGTNIDVDDTDPANPVISSTLGAVNLKGRKAAYAELPSSGNSSGDAWVLDSDKLIYVWDGSSWPDDGEGLALSNARLKAWRIKITAVVSGLSSDVAQVGQVLFGVPNANGILQRQANGASFADSFIADDGNGPYGPSNAFDGDANDPPWSSESSLLPHYLGIAQPYGTVDSITMTARSLINTTTANWVPKDFTIQSSTDTTTGLDGTWTDEWNVTGQTGWTSKESRTFMRP